MGDLPGAPFEEKVTFLTFEISRQPESKTNLPRSPRLTSRVGRVGHCGYGRLCRGDGVLIRCRLCGDIVDAGLTL